MLIIIKRLISESLTTLYSLFWSSFLIAGLLTVVFMYSEKQGGLKATVKEWGYLFKSSFKFRRVFKLCLSVSFILVGTLLSRTYWSNPLSNVFGAWSIYKNDGTWTIEPIKNVLLFVPYILTLFSAADEKILKNDKLCTVLFTAVRYSFQFSVLIETLQLLFSLGTFQFSDLFYNTLGGVIGGLLYWICYRVKQKRT